MIQIFLFIDHYDSFVYNLVRYFHELGVSPGIHSHDTITINDIYKMAPEGIILSPGPGTPGKTGTTLEVICHFAGKIPILGICLGHQTIGHAFGAKVIKGQRPVHGKISEIYHDGKGVFEGIPQGFSATRYHSLIIEENTLPEELIVTAKTSDGVIMGIRHRDLPVEGVQFHPEAALTQYGHMLLNNFIKRCKQT